MKIAVALQVLGLVAIALGCFLVWGTGAGLLVSGLLAVVAGAVAEAERR